MDRLIITHDEETDIKRNPFAWKHISAETIELPAQRSLAYKFTGATHYLALHDLVVTDGEVRCDGGPKPLQLDCRDRITFVPAGCTVDGWGLTGRRNNDVTAIFYDQYIVERELEGRAGVSVGPPMLYFEDASLRITLGKIRSQIKRPTPGSEIYVEMLGLLAVIELDRLQKSTASQIIPKSGNLSEAQQRMLRDYIMDNIHRTIGLSELANLANLSRFHLLRAFKKSLGVTPYKYIMERRVERAKELLSGTELPIAAISDLCGFGAFAHFSATFRRMTGSTPTQFRLIARGHAR